MRGTVLLLALSATVHAEYDELDIRNPDEYERVVGLLNRLHHPRPPPPPPPLPPRPPPPPPAPPAPPPAFLTRGFNFDELPKGWQTKPKPGFASDVKWDRGSGPTPTRFTGPDGDHTTLPFGYGHYYFVESSPPRNPGDEAWLGGPTHSECVRGISFWYHMTGVTMGALELWTKGRDQAAFTKQWHRAGNQPGGDKGWHQAVIDLSGTPLMEPSEVRFVGIIGPGYLSDVAIDDLELTLCGTGARRPKKAPPAPPRPPPPPNPPAPLLCSGWCRASRVDADCKYAKCRGCPYCLPQYTPPPPPAASECCSFNSCRTCGGGGALNDGDQCGTPSKCRNACGGEWCGGARREREGRGGGPK